MGTLKHRASEKRLSLGARSLVGRALGCLVRLDDGRVSAEHASVFWSGARWEARDLGSTNGTIVDGKRLTPGDRVPLREGSELSFGSDDVWILADTLPPTACARRRDASSGAAEILAAESGLLALPSAAEPLVSLFDDGDGRWLVEIQGATRPAVDQEIIEAGGAWVLGIPPAAAGGTVGTTRRFGAPALSVEALSLRFAVTRDEEHVELTLAQGDETIALGARAHHYVLLTLARAWLADEASAEISPAERGWMYVDDLLEKLRYDPERLGVSIFRIRRQLADAGVSNAGSVVERRLGTRQIRLRAAKVEVRLLS